MPSTSFSLLLSLLLLGFSACSTESPLYDLDDLQGKWLRISSNDTRSDSMILEVRNDSAVILHAPSGSNFASGQVKWRSLNPIARPGDFECTDLSANGERWPATIYVAGISATTISGEIDLSSQKFSNAPGGNQIWIKIP